MTRLARGLAGVAAAAMLLGAGPQVAAQTQQGQGVERPGPGMGPGRMAPGREARRGYRGHGGMGHGGMMMAMMFALMDADGDGSLSREEWLEAQERVYNALDRAGDGQVTAEDLRAFMAGRGAMMGPMGRMPEGEE